MGVYSEFLTHTAIVDQTEPQVGLQRVVYNELLALQGHIDPDYVAGFDAQNETQTIAQHVGTVSSGNFTLTIMTPEEDELTTANIAYDANAATIEGAIDVACTGNIAGWTNGDISVSGGPLTTDDVVLTFDGGSVDSQNFGQTTITDVDLAGGGTVGVPSTTIHGQPKRYAWAVMYNLGLFAAPPEYGEALAVDAETATSPGENPKYPSPALRKILAWQAAIDDDNPLLREQLERLFHVQ